MEMKKSHKQHETPNYLVRTIYKSEPRSIQRVTSDDSSIRSRGNWSNPVEFTLACVGYAVGLGNVWRFPYLVFRNGGGAFLVPYFLMAFIIGLPVFFAELFVGQYSGFGPIKAYHHLAPFFEGLGYCTLIVISFVTVYYMVIIAWIIFYFFASFTSELQWGNCDNYYNSGNCYTNLEDFHCKQNNTNSAADKLFWNKTCTSIAEICSTKNLLGINASYCASSENTSLLLPVRSVIKRVLSSEEYYYNYVLDIGDATWSNWGYPKWQLLLCLLLGWLIAFFCLIEGVQSAGKVVYFTALFPYVLLTALLIRSSTLTGAIEGILFYIYPDWSILFTWNVWGDAASQIFYSFGLACGSLVAFASYNQFNNNCHTDAVVISLTNVVTCVYAGFSVFAALGFMAKNMEVPVAEVVQSGPGLVFIAYPEAMLMMPLPQLWSILFFLMMFTLGMGSQFGGIEAICTSLIDHWPHLGQKRWKVTASVCILCFLCGIPMVCNGGIYLFTLMEWHTASWAILLLGLAEVVILSWCYGIDRAFHNFLEMGIKLNIIMRIYWKIVWIVLTPIASVAVFIFIMAGIGATEFGSYKFPLWADLLGWSMGALTLLPFPICIIYGLLKKKNKKGEWFTPTEDWRPQGSTIQTNKIMKGFENSAYVHN